MLYRMECLHFSIPSKFSFVLTNLTRTWNPLDSFSYHFDTLGAPLKYFECPVKTVWTSFQLTKLKKSEHIQFSQNGEPRGCLKGTFVYVSLQLYRNTRFWKTTLPWEQEYRFDTWDCFKIVFFDSKCHCKTRQTQKPNRPPPLTPLLGRR